MLIILHAYSENWILWQVAKIYIFFCAIVKLVIVCVMTNLENYVPLFDNFI